MADEVMEFRLINPTEGDFLQSIEWNRDEIEDAIREKMAGYQNLVYTEETLGDAKKDRAELNNLIKAIEEKRKQVKKIVNEPYERFESEVKEVLELIRQPVALIDKQVKQFEDDQKEEKRKQIEEAYNSEIGEMAEILPFDKLFDPRYLNKTYKLSDAKSEVVEQIKRVKTDLESIDGLDSKYRLNAKDVYIKTLDLSKAMAENKRLLDLEEKLEADRKRKEEEERITKEQAEEKRKAMELAKEMAEGTKAAIEQSAEKEKTVEEAKEASEESEAVQPKQYRIKFEVVGTREELEALVGFMGENHLEYKKIQ